MPSALVLESVAIVVSTARRVSSHFDAIIVSRRVSFISQSSELVVGGGLQRMEPLRSTKNSRLEGRSDDCSVMVAQLLRRIESAEGEERVNTVDGSCGCAGGWLMTAGFPASSERCTSIIG